MSSYSVAFWSFFTILLLLLSPLNGMGEDLCEIPAMRIAQRPGHGGPPTEVTMGILVTDITAIDDVAQNLTGDFIVEMTWVDTRLAGEVGCRFPLSKIWSPRIEALNSVTAVAKRAFEKDQVEIGTGGRVRHYQRWNSSIATYHHLAKFPFDPQEFRFQFTSIEYDSKEVTIKADTEITQVNDLVNIPDWTIGKASASIEHRDIFGLRLARSIFVLELQASRNINFYVWKVLVPLGLIVMMSWAVFWINPVRFGPQLGLSATSMLTLIAFQFSLTGVLPKLSYFTTMDKLILGSSILVFLSFFESVLTINMVSRGKEGTAIKIDEVCRWFFPLIIVAYCIAVMVF